MLFKTSKKNKKNEKTIQEKNRICRVGEYSFVSVSYIPGTFDNLTLTDQLRHTCLNLWTKKSPDFPLNHTLDYIYFSFLLANKIILLLTPETHVLLNPWTNVGFIPRTKKHFQKFFFKILFPLPCNNFLLEQLVHSLKSLFF